MNKIKEIILSYAAAINPTEEQKKVAEVRLATCMGCEQWGESALGVAYCKLCGCATKGKVFTPVGMQACPLNKWKI
jgi:hypothetical protein